MWLLAGDAYFPTWMMWTLFVVVGLVNILQTWAVGNCNYLALWICLLPLRSENKFGFTLQKIWKLSINSKIFPIENLIRDCELTEFCKNDSLIYKISIITMKKKQNTPNLRSCEDEREYIKYILLRVSIFKCSYLNVFFLVEIWERKFGIKEMPLFQLFIFASVLFEGFFFNKTSCGIYHTTYFGLCVPGHYCTLSLIVRRNRMSGG